SFIEAAKRGDAGFFKQSLTSDFSYVSYDGQLYDRQEMVDQYSQAGSNIQPYEMKVVSAGDAVAIVTYNVVFLVPPSQDQSTPPALSALHYGVGETGRFLEDEVSADDRRSLGRLVKTICELAAVQSGLSEISSPLETITLTFVIDQA